MTDETESNDTDEYSMDFDSLFGSFQTSMGSSFGTETFEQPEEVEISVQLIKAAHAFNRFMDYTEEHDIDPTEIDPADFDDLDYEQQLLLTSFSSLAQAMIRFGEQSDDDDDNPFKVGDGDEPIY